MFKSRPQFVDLLLSTARGYSTCEGEEDTLAGRAGCVASTARNGGAPAAHDAAAGASAQRDRKPTAYDERRRPAPGDRANGPRRLATAAAVTSRYDYGTMCLTMWKLRSTPHGYQNVL